LFTLSAVEKTVDYVIVTTSLASYIQDVFSIPHYTEKFAVK